MATAWCSALRTGIRRRSTKLYLTGIDSRPPRALRSSSGRVTMQVTRAADQVAHQVAKVIEVLGGVDGLPVRPAAH
ncbi:MAG: hypothetical protein R2706_13555 [Acidimicrobiales bacterium]